MVPKPLITPIFALPRSILMPASFAACGLMLAVLFLVLVGCAAVLGVADVNYATPNDKNAVRCSCDCSGVAPPTSSPNTVRTGADDVSQDPGKNTASLTVQVLELGDKLVGLRFQKLGVPPKAEISTAVIQFTAAEMSSTAPGDYDIFAVDSSNAPPFTADTNLNDVLASQTIATPVPWTVGPWQTNERGSNEVTAELRLLVQTIVNRDGYAPDNAIAFVIRGSGRRVARAFESANLGRPATLNVAYAPRKITQEFLACGNASDDASRAHVCALVQENVNDLANKCQLLSNACTCAVVNSDPTSFAKVCNDTCPKLTAPDNCDPNAIAKATAATDANTPVCVGTSPLGSVLFGQRSACDIEPSQSNVHARIFKGSDSNTSDAPPRGRIEFVGAPCPDDSCSVGMTHRMNVGDMTFATGGLFTSDTVVNQLTGVGESAINAFVDATATGTFAKGLTNHAMRGNLVGGDTVAVARANDGPVAISIGVDPTQPGGWRPGGICTMKGTLFQVGNTDDGGLEMFVDIKGRLVNQPPTADAGPDLTVECNATGRGIFTLDGSAQDPDENVASISWFRDSRIGPPVGTLSTVELEQPVKSTTSYVLKVIDTFGQYSEDTTQVSVVDTTAPAVTAPPTVTAECAGATGTPVTIGAATATDVCDPSPVISSNAPQLFPLGITTVTWSGKDDSGNVGTATQAVKIIDTTPPQLAVTLSPAVLWPPNHVLVPITASITVTDVCDPHPTVRLMSITSNEPDNGLGDGDTSRDIQGATLGADDRAFLLRSERSGLGNGRVYTVTYEASDASGNKTTKTATVTVPKSP